MQIIALCVAFLVDHNGGSSQLLLIHLCMFFLSFQSRGGKNIFLSDSYIQSKQREKNFFMISFVILVWI
jgi:hypothetical protein